MRSCPIVPFGALFDASAGRFLVESFEITVAPSLELYRASVARYGEFRETRPTVLAGGQGDIYVARLRDDRGFDEPELLPCDDTYPYEAVNSPFDTCGATGSSSSSTARA